VFEDHPAVLWQVRLDEREHGCPVGRAVPDRGQTDVDVESLEQGYLFDVGEPIVPGEECTGPLRGSGRIPQVRPKASA
jgi:hypothetical protein